MNVILKSHAKVGVYVDAANISRNGGQRMQYDVLREFACRDQAEPLRLNVYLTYDEERAETNTVYRDKARAYQSALRELGYKVIEKRVKWFQDEAGNRYGKARLCKSQIGNRYFFKPHACFFAVGQGIGAGGNHKYVFVCVHLYARCVCSAWVGRFTELCGLKITLLLKRL